MKSVSILIAGVSPLVLAQSLTTVIPEPQGTELSAEPITVSGSFDGGMKLYDRSRKWTCFPNIGFVQSCAVVVSRRRATASKFGLGVLPCID